MARVDGGPAFPHLGSDEHVGIWIDQPGMSLRDYIAARALAGILANPSINVDVFSPQISRLCYEHADAMLAERAKAVGDV